MRASDEDRRRVVAALERHTGAGRLTLDEFAQRVDVVEEARTLDDLAAVIRDLPAESPVDSAADAPLATKEPEHGHELLWILAIAALTLILLVGFMALRH